MPTLCLNDYTYDIVKLIPSSGTAITLVSGTTHSFEIQTGRGLQLRWSYRNFTIAWKRL